MSVTQLSLTHRISSDRSASLQALTDPAALLVRFDDGQGKSRKKTFKIKDGAGAEHTAWGSALRFLFREGFIAPAPQDGPLRWMTVTDEPFPRGPCFVVDTPNAAVWVGDTGVLRRVARGSCSQQDFALGPGVLPRRLVLSGQGGLLMLLDIESSAIDRSVSPWLPPASNGSFRAIARFQDGDSQIVVQVPYSPIIADALVDMRDGEFLGPHAQGAAVYDRNGAIQEVFTAARTRHHPPQASISDYGAQLALTHNEGSVRIVDRSTQRERIAATGFSQIHGLEFHATDALLIRGCHESEGWGLFREESGALEHISKDVRAELAEDGKRVAELSRRLVITNLAEDNLELDLPLPALGMAKHGRPLFVGERSVIVQTDTHTLGEVEYSTR